MSNIDEIFLNLPEKKLEELKEAFDFLLQEEKKISIHRHQLHQEIDQLRRELSRRLKKGISLKDEELFQAIWALIEGKDVIPLEPADLSNWSAITETKITSSKKPEKLSLEEIKEKLEFLLKEEGKVSYKRRLMQGKIDLLKDEVKKRLAKKENLVEAKDLEELVHELTAVLSNGF